MNKEAYVLIDFDILPNQFVYGQPALVGKVGFAGEFSISFNPKSEKFETRYHRIGAEDIDVMYSSLNLNDAVSILNETFFIGVRSDEMIGEFEDQVNKANAVQMDFVFQASDLSLSDNPSLTCATPKGVYYIAWEDDYVAGFDGNEADEEPFAKLDQALNFLQEKFKVRLSDGSMRELNNFLSFIKLKRLEKAVAA